MHPGTSTTNAEALAQGQPGSRSVPANAADQAAKRQMFIPPQFWRLDVQDEAVGPGASGAGPLPGFLSVLTGVSFVPVWRERETSLSSFSYKAVFSMELGPHETLIIPKVILRKYGGHER